MKFNDKVKRGEIYFYNFGENPGSIQCGERPVMVVQCVEGNQASPTTIIAAISSAIKKRYLPTHIFLGECFGLKKPSMVMLEQLKTVNQDELIDYIGCADEAMLRVVNNALKKGLGLWHYTPDTDKDVRCLCVHCLENYKSNPDVTIRRRNPYSKVTDSCDLCGKAGYDYVVREKKTMPKNGGGKNV